MRRMRSLSEVQVGEASICATQALAAGAVRRHVGGLFFCPNAAEEMRADSALICQLRAITKRVQQATKYGSHMTFAAPRVVAMLASHVEEI